MKSTKLLFAALLSWLVLACALPGQAAWAEEKKEGGDGYIKIEPITVNLGTTQQVLQISISLKGESPELAVAVSNRMPIVRHKLIMLLSAQTSDTIMSTQGKTNLMAEVKVEVNKALKLGDKDGVTDVVIENFIVQ